jgi:hypothetical protein
VRETSWRVRMWGTEKALRQFLSRHPNEPLSIRRDGAQVILELLLPEALLSEAERFGSVKRLYDAGEVGRARQSQVGSGNRYADGQIPVGLGLRR